MNTVELRFYGPLNDFLPRPLRGRTLRREVAPHQTVTDVIEACNVPHPELGLIVVDGEPADGTRRLSDGSRVAVFPPGRTFLPRLESPDRFVLDVHLGRLARLLRLLGFDAWYRNDTEDAELASRSADDNRVLLTRDVGLLKRKVITHGYLVRSDRPVRQALEVTDRYRLAERAEPFTRCLHCSGKLVRAAKREVAHRLEPGTKATYDEFRTCARCDQVYWAGAHHERLQRVVGLILRVAA